MRCPVCEFENVPGLTTCFRCGSVLDAEQVSGSIYPTRAPEWKRPLRNIRRWMRHYSLSRWVNADSKHTGRPVAVRPGSFASRLRVFRASRKILVETTFYLMLSILPGLSHVIQHRFGKIRWYFLAWFVSLAMGLFLYGTSMGLILCGVSVGCHTWIAADGANLMKPLEGFRSRACAMLLIMLLVWGMYRTIGQFIFSDLTLANISFAVPRQNVKRGDLLLARRSSARAGLLPRGALVQIPVRMLGGGYYRFSDRAVIGEVVGLPGETIQVEDGGFIVEDSKLDPEQYPVPLWLAGQSFSSTLPKRSYFVSSEYTVRAYGRTLSDAMIEQACVVAAGRIEACVFMRWLPLRRRGWLKEIE